ncbi:MAG: hypothetical protein ACFB2W_00815 [Leptolyngbyaceae cyanobacterium]
MQIEYTNTYTKHGCSFTGNLAVVDYYSQMQEISSGQPLGGFGQMACFDALDEAKALLKKTHGDNYEVLLGIPDLVVRLCD